MMICYRHRYKLAAKNSKHPVTTSEGSSSDIMYSRLCSCVESHNRIFELVLPVIPSTYLRFFKYFLRILYLNTSCSFINEIESIYATNFFVQISFAIITFTITLVMVSGILSILFIRLICETFSGN